MTAQITPADPWTRLIHLWPLLAMTRIPGTRRPWRPSEMTPERRAQRDQRDRQDRDERLGGGASEFPLGLGWLSRPGAIFTSPHVPMHLDVLDTLEQLHTALWVAATELGISGAALGLAVRSSLGDPRPLLEWCRERARSLPGSLPVDRGAWDMLHTIERALGEIWDGQKLKAECPWCHGGLVIDRQTWRVRMLPGGMPAIVCESGTCQPPDSDVGTWWRNLPAWPLWEWIWLCQRLESDEEAQARRRAELKIAR